MVLVRLSYKTDVVVHIRTFWAVAWGFRNGPRNGGWGVVWPWFFGGAGMVARLGKIRLSALVECGHTFSKRRGTAGRRNQAAFQIELGLEVRAVLRVQQALR
jgi:hypothetical protein